jgi:YD repeat-containing protein
MTSFTHKPFIGATTQNDPNNQVLSYSYDGFHRLLNVRNRNGEILKQYAYKYQEQVTATLSTTPNWVSTNFTRCIQVPPNNNYSGLQEYEEKDMNPASSTYLQSRYLPGGNSANCIPIPNCSGVDKRVVNGICVTGERVTTFSNQLPNGSWECIFYYQWVGFRSQDYYEYNVSSCWKPVD